MRRAFTLLELLIVLAIITTVAGISVVSFQRQMARARFKAGVVEVQIDLRRTRLLAMRTGTPYIFRYAPGSGVYEIAPLDALQEAIYRQNEATDVSGAFDGDAIGGSLTETAFGAESAGLATDAGLYGLAETDAAPSYADDLFSPENVAADLERLGIETGSLLGGAGMLPAFDALSLGDATDASGGAVGLAVDPTTGLAPGLAASTAWRELKAEEKALLGDGGETLAWRVGPDGVVFRKAASGDVVFTFMRISASTPLNLKTRRASGLDRTEAEAVDDALGDGTFESRLTGSLAAPPKLAEDSPFAAPRLDEETDAAFSGGLDELAGSLGLETAAARSGPAASNVWSEPIVFYPNGRVSSAIFGIACVGSIPYYSEIAIRGMTGVARISSISTLPPGSDPAGSALTAEQLFRLSNPYAVATTAAETEKTGSLAAGETGKTGSLAAGNGAPGAASSGLDPLVSTEESDPPAARRSGYRFDVAPSNAAGSATTDALDPPTATGTSAADRPQTESALAPNAGGVL